MASLRGGHPQETVHYTAAKAALNAYTQGSHGRRADGRITVNAVAPGFVEHAAPGSAGRSPRRIRESGRGHPGGSTRHTARIAAVIRFVASEAASYLMGEVVTVSGGL